MEEYQKGAWGYAGIGVCFGCYNPEHLFVYSKEVYRNHKNGTCLHCLDLILRGALADDLDSGLIFAMNTIPTAETFTILKDHYENCAMCEMPFVEGSSMFESSVASLKDERTIIVHSRCRNKCHECKTEYASLEFRRINPYNREYKFGFSDTMPHKTVDDRSFCETCYDAYIENHGGEDNFYFCEACEHLYHDDNTRTWEDRIYCSDCFHERVYFCDDCEERYWGDDGHSCSNNDDSAHIFNYSYKPRPLFFGEDRFHLGFELEIEVKDNYSRSEISENVYNAVGSNAYMKDDGSLNYGFEIVSHPHTLKEFENFNWSILKQLKKTCRSWDTDTCGLHVHVSRSGFGDLFDREHFESTRAYHSAVALSRQAHELRFMKLIYDNERQVKRISGRSSSYASFEDKGQLVQKIKWGTQNNGRYSAVNTENDSTIEVRVFRGSLRKERVMSAIEFVHSAVEYTRDLKVNGKDKSLSWLKFAGFISKNTDKYPNLALIMNETFLSDESPNDDVR